MASEIELGSDSGGSSEVTGGSSSSDSQVPLEEDVSGTSPAQTVFNIVKNVVGEGMLSLPAGVAAGTGVGTAVLIAAFFGALMGYTFAGVGRVCSATASTSHKAAGAATVGAAFGELMSVVIMLKTTFTCISYTMVLGDSYSELLHFFGWHGWMTNRQMVICVIMGTILTPLCLQRDLSILSYTSLAGVLCEVFVVVFMQVRLLDGSYVEGGRFYALMPEEDRKWFGDPDVPHYMGVSVSTWVLLCMLSTAFTAHYNAPKFYCQMRKRTPRRFTCVTAVSFAIIFGIFAWVMVVGYLTFGARCRGLILNNYSEQDPLASWARVAIGIAVLFGFPLSFTALRDSTLASVGLPPQRRWFYLITAALLLSVATLGCLLDDLGLVNSLGGAIFGASITMVFPGILIYVASRESKSDEAARRWFPGERALSAAIVVGGVSLCLVGGVVVLLKRYSPETLGLPGESGS